nr:PREDICTED: Fanconi anemia group A protein-like [Bemisia tabaci]
MANPSPTVSEYMVVLKSIVERYRKPTKSSHPNVLLSSLDRGKLSTTIQKFSELDSHKELRTWLTTLEKPVNVEILWLLNRKYVLQISSYLYLFEKFHDCFVRDLVLLATAPEREEYAQKILIDILLQLLCVNDAVPSLYQIYQSLQSKFIKEVIKILYTENAQTVHNYLEDLSTKSDFLESERKRFCSSHLTELLSYDPKKISLFDAISDQIVWFEYKSPSSVLRQFVYNLLKVFSCKEVFEQIFSVISASKFNLQKVLNFISLVCTHYGEKPCLEIVEERFCGATTDHNDHMVYVSLLFIRQIFLQDSVSFQKYAKWFKSLRLNNAQFSFLFQCLTRIVPYEPPLCLKIHINEFPNVPCRTTVSDYNLLVKTRLMDLKETMEYQGIFYLSDKSGQKADLRKIISHFVETGEVAKLLIEASVFRRQYFNNVFLPYLLGSESEDLEGKTKFIERLNKQGLIPSFRYVQWQKSLRNRS